MRPRPAHGRESALANQSQMTDKPRESSRLLPRQRLMRVIGRPGRDGRLSPGQKTLLLFAALLLLAALLAWIVAAYGAAATLFQRQDLSKE